MDPSKVIRLEKDEQYWDGKGKTKKAPEGKRRDGMAVGDCSRPATSRWEKIETETALGKDSLDEALIESGWGTR